MHGGNWKSICATRILEGHLELDYQPILDVESNKITTFEALLRWNHPERGRVAPAEFIPIAEETGLIGPIGEWVLRTACAQAVTWPADVKVAVNLSLLQFNWGDLVQLVSRSLAAAGLGRRSAGTGDYRIGADGEHGTNPDNTASAA